MVIAANKKIGTIYRDLVAADITRRLNGCPNVFLLNFLKVRSVDMTRLRKELKTSGAKVLVAKNSFIRKVFEQDSKTQAASRFVLGPTAVVFVKDDPISASKALMSFAKAHEELLIQGGFLSERAVGLEEIKFISKIPSRQALYQQVAGTLNAPIGKLAVCLNQIMAKLVYAVKAVSDKKK